GPRRVGRRWRRVGVAAGEDADTGRSAAEALGARALGTTLLVALQVIARAAGETPKDEAQETGERGTTGHVPGGCTARATWKTAILGPRHGKRRVRWYRSGPARRGSSQPMLRWPIQPAEDPSCAEPSRASTAMVEGKVAGVLPVPVSNPAQ